MTVTPTISFDATDWNTAKTVTVTGEEDVDTVGESVSISYAISGGGYDLATLTDQVVSVTDDDLAGVGVTSDGGASVAVTEGSEATYELVLTVAPTGTVTIALTSDDTSAVTVTPTISFDATDWNTAKTVTVTGEEDVDTVGESVSISYAISGGGYDLATLTDQVVSVTDDDLAGVGVTSTGGASVAVTEGSEATYELVLTVAPTGTVTIALTSDDTSAVTVTPTISFDATDWNTAKTVTVTGEEDVDTVGESVSISYAISGGGYDLATLTDQVVSVTDDDLAGVGVTSTGGASVAVTEGSEATYELVLTVAPTGTVTIALTSDDTSAVTVTPTISFDATDWNTAKTVTVTGEEDVDTVGESVSISYAISGGGYDLATLTDQVVAVTDDDLAGVGVTSTGGASVAVTEGSEATYELVLTVAPTGTVTIALTSDDTSAVTVTPTISFDATDWNTAKTVTVTGVEDVDTVGESVSISYAISGGGYDLATLTDQVVSVTDDDLAGVGVTSTGGASVAVTEGSEATYELVLTVAPTGTVTIALTSDDTSSVTVTPTISFDATDWNTAKTVTVTGEEDVDTVGESVSISYAISGGGYDLATLTDQVVAVTDDDLAGVGVTSDRRSQRSGNRRL